MKTTEDQHKGETTTIKIDGISDLNLSSLIMGRWFTESVQNNPAEMREHGAESYLLKLLKELYPGSDPVLVQGRVEFKGDMHEVERDARQFQKLCSMISGNGPWY